LNDLGPNLDLVGPGDAYLRGLAAEGRPVAKDKLRPEPLPGGRMVLIRGGKDLRGFRELQQALDAAQDGDIIEIRTDAKFAGGNAPKDRGALTLRAGPGCRPVVMTALVVPLGTALAMEGLTFSGTAGVYCAGDRKVPVEKQGRISRLAYCAFDRSTVDRGFGPGVVANVFQGKDGEMIRCVVLGTLRIVVDKGTTFRIRECILNSVHSNPVDEKSKAGTVELEASICVQMQLGAILVDYGLSRWVTRGCLFDSNSYLCANAGLPPEWTGKRNCYRLGTGFESIFTLTSSLPQWRAFTKSQETGSVEVLPPIADPQTWRLRPGSPASGFGPDVDRVGRTAEGPVHLPHWVEHKWIEEVSQLPVEQQIVAVRGMLKERNPGFDGKVDAKIEDGRVVEFDVVTDAVFDVSPLRVFAGLRKLRCRGSGEGKGILSDLSPLQGMKLTELDCGFTLVTNLKPLAGLPLRKFNYPYRSWLGAEPLRSISTLDTINGKPAAAFWKKVAAEAQQFEKFRKFVALLPAEAQVKAVADRLKERNPGFTGTPDSKIDEGAVTEISFPTDAIVDISPVRALPRLQSLTLGWPYTMSKLVDLTPLQGMKLTSLNLIHCVQVPDLTPLQGMKLTTLSLDGCVQVRDLTPLHGMKLTSLNLSQCRVRDLTPLEGMKLTWLGLGLCGHVRDLTPLQGMKLTELNLMCCGQVRDLTPLHGMKLTSLDLTQCVQVRDLTPLQGMKMTSLILNGCAQVRDLTPLHGMKLTSLILFNSQVRDLTPLQGMELTSLSLSTCGQVRDLTPLQGMKLTSLDLMGCVQVRDLTPLRGMKLTSLMLLYCGQVRDLTPLQGMKLKTLYADGAGVQDLTPLEGMPLEEFTFTPKNITKGIDVIRRMTTLKKIGVQHPPSFTLAEFWKKYQAGEFGKTPGDKS